MNPALQIRATMVAAWLNEQQQRAIEDLKEEFLSKIIPIGERHLRKVIEAYTAQYHLERNHQGLCNQLINGHVEREPVFHVKCHERLGGIFRSYHRAA